MPITYQIRKAAGICYITVTGAPDLADYLANADALMSDEDYPDCIVDILDLTAKDHEELSGDDIQELKQKDLEFGDMLRSRKLAIIAPQDHAYGISRMYTSFSDNTFAAVRVFRDRASAEAWLGIKLD